MKKAFLFEIKVASVSINGQTRGAHYLENMGLNAYTLDKIFF